MLLFFELNSRPFRFIVVEILRFISKCTALCNLFTDCEKKRSAYHLHFVCTKLLYMRMCSQDPICNCVQIN